MKKEYAPLIVRLAISLVISWFGVNQLVMPEEFFGYLPNFILTSDYAAMAVMANGVFEIILGGLLLAGLFTKLTALILSLHLFIIVLSLGYNDIAIRDLGLSLITFSIFIGGADKWTLDYKRKHS